MYEHVKKDSDNDNDKIFGEDSPMFSSIKSLDEDEHI